MLCGGMITESWKADMNAGEPDKPNNQRDDEYVVPLEWRGLEEHVPSPVNQFVSQFTDDMFFVSFGLATPPLLPKDLERRKARLEAMESVPVSPVARLALTPERMRELIEVLQTNLQRYEAQHGWDDLDDDETQGEA